MLIVTLVPLHEAGLGAVDPLPRALGEPVRQADPHLLAQRGGYLADVVVLVVGEDGDQVGLPRIDAMKSLLLLKALQVVGTPIRGPELYEDLELLSVRQQCHLR